MLFYYITRKTFQDNLHLFPDKDKEIVLYIDLQNTCKSLFLEEIIYRTYDYVVESGNMEISPFTSIINYIIKSRLFFNEYGYNKIRFIFFLDKGGSIYHLAFHKGYKKSRKLIKYVIDQKIIDLYHFNLRKNWKLCDIYFNNIKNIHFIYLENLESDFVPYYIINDIFDNENRYHIILSTDKDMLQIIDQENIYQYIKTSNFDSFVSKNDVIHKLLDAHKNTRNLNKIEENEWFRYSDALDLIFAFSGDLGDDIKGIPKVGHLTAIKMLDTFTKELNISLDELRKKIKQKEKIEYNKHKSSIKKYVDLFNNHIEDVYISYHLVSYEALVDWINICSNKIDDNLNMLKENKEYYLNSKLKDYLDIIRNNILNNNKITFNKEQFIHSIKNIKGGVFFKNCNIRKSLIDSYFNAFGEF